MKKRGKRGGKGGVRGVPRLPRGEGGQRAAALHVLFMGEARRGQAEAKAACVYAWEARPHGDCSECGVAAAKRFSGRPPIALDMLPRAEDLCSPCAAAFEELARTRKAAHVG